MEFKKIQRSYENYHKNLNQIIDLGFDTKDYIHHTPAFTGKENIARFLSLYEAYKMTLGLSGHIAEVGVFKGGALLYFAKLAQLFEPNSFTTVFGFDWFKGMEPDPSIDNLAEKEKYQFSEQKLRDLIKLQELDNLVNLYNLDARTELKPFMDEHQSLTFKLVFLDAGMYDVVKACLPIFWERMNKGSVLLLDQYNDNGARGETKAVREFFGDSVQIRTFPFSWQPTAYIIKE